jgi:hypothetical protein
MSQDALYFQLSQLTEGAVSAERWAVILTLPQELQQLEFENFAEMDWTKPSTSAGAALIQTLLAAATVAGAVTGIAGAATAVAALKNL